MVDMYEDSPHHDIRNIPWCKDYCLLITIFEIFPGVRITVSSSRYSNIPLAKKLQFLCSCKSAMLLPILYDYQVSCAATNIV
jgi:hypothetical protein